MNRYWWISSFIKVGTTTSWMNKGNDLEAEDALLKEEGVAP